MALRIAIAGRPNVGKSTLFNRLVGRKLALVDDRPGVTRDRREGDAQLGDIALLIIDTAGLEDAKGEGLTADIQRQTALALENADAVLFMVDARAGLTPQDETIARRLRRSGRRVILAANKCESQASLSGLGEAHALGFGEPIALSAEHGLGLDALYDALRPLAKPEDIVGAQEDRALPEDEDIGAGKPVRIAVVGRPNAGKSTLINALLGEERLVTSAEAGTTRDAIAVPLTWKAREFLVFDTAGMRRRARVTEKIEKLAVSDALRAIRFAEVVVVAIDATAPFEAQDLAIADLVEREGRAIVFAVTKWDLVDNANAERKKLREKLDRLLPQVVGAPMIAVSGLRGEGLDRLMQAIADTHAIWNKRVPTAAINRFLEAALDRNPPPAVKGRRIKIRYMTQAKARPPTFVLFGNQLAALPESYTRYIVNGLREAFGLKGVPIRVQVRQTKNPYAEEGR